MPGSIPSSYFTGRGDELQQIDRAFSASFGDLPACCVIHGMPVVGKTQLVLQYAALASGKSRYTYTFWLSAGSVEKLPRDSRMVDLLRLPERYALDQVTKLSVVRALCQDPTCEKRRLLILDNVTRETTRMILDQVLPQRNSGGRLPYIVRTASIAESCTVPCKSLILPLQPSGINDAFTILAAGAEMVGGITEEASYADLECLVWLVGNDIQLSNPLFHLPYLAKDLELIF